MEALSSILNRAKEGSFISGFSSGGRGGVRIEVSHLLFVDDILSFAMSHRTKWSTWGGFSCGLK
ncbi:hypothetical protein AAG906_037762 [Vitis piasezkii]